MTITDAHEILIDFITSNNDIAKLPVELKDAIEKIDLYDEQLMLAKKRNRK